MPKRKDCTPTATPRGEQRLVKKPAKKTPQKALNKSEKRIALAEEKLTLDKRTVETGRVRVRTHVEEEQTTVKGTVSSETLEFETVTIGRRIDAAPPIREENGVLIVPIVEERLIAAPQLYLAEELHIHRRRTSKPAKASGTRRTMRAEIERIDPAANDTPPQTERT